MKRRIDSVLLRTRRSAGRPPRGFTLVELLVVIAIIGMLMALLIPAVQMAREAARRATCMNNQKNIGLAITNFATARDRMPSGFSAHPLTPAGDTTGNYCMGWVIPLLPYMEQKPIYDRIQTNYTALRTPAAAGIDGHLSLLICPTRSDPGTPAPNSYVVNAGMTDNYANSGANPLDYQANGVFFDHYSTDYPVRYPNPGNKGPRITTDLSYISDHDGIISTVLFSENVDAGDWIGSSPQVQLPMLPSPVEGQTWGQGIVWKLNLADVQSDGTVYPFFLNRTVETLGVAKNDDSAAKPTSAHPGGYLMTMVDGHTIFVSEDVDYRVYALVMTPWGSGQENKYPSTNNYVTYPSMPAAPAPGAWVDSSGGLVPVTEADLTR